MGDAHAAVNTSTMRSGKSTRKGLSGAGDADS